MGILDFLSNKGHKDIVGITVTPSLGLEVVILDKDSRSVKNYGRRKIDYDISRREISDLDQFKNALGDLIAQMQILQLSAKPMAYLVLPNVYFDFLEVPNDTSNDEVKTAILSEAEEFFIFKREEPVSGHCEVYNPNSVERKKIVYSSFQKDHVEHLKSAIEDCGLQLIGVETNYTATLRGLHTAGLVDDVEFDESCWTAMIINTNSFVMFKMEGKNLIGHLEVPLAVRAYSVEEAYEAIISNASQILEDYQSSKLIIISQVDEISADVVKRKIQFSDEIIAIECNKFASGNQLLEVTSALDFNEANSMTPASIGAAYINPDFELVLNTMADDLNSNLGVYLTTEFLGQKVIVTKELVQKLAIVALILVAGVAGGVGGFIKVVDGTFKSQLSDIDGQIQQVDNQIAEASKEGDKEEIDMNTLIDEVAEDNVAAISFYDSIATDIPKNIWLTTYYNKGGSKIAIKGIAENIADVYEYYKNLRIVSPDSDIKLNELKVFTNEADTDPNNPDAAVKNKISNLLIEDSDRLYSFEISNTQIADTVTQVLERNENEIIKRIQPSQGSEEENIEEVSQIMKPVRKQKRKNGKVN